MKLILSKHEFEQLREVICNIDNDSVTKEYNRIVTNQNPHIEASTTTDTLSLSISAELSDKIGKVLISHSKGIGKNLSVNLTSLPKTINQTKKLFNDLGKAIKSHK